MQIRIHKPEDSLTFSVEERSGIFQVWLPVRIKEAIFNIDSSIYKLSPYSRSIRGMDLSYINYAAAKYKQAQKLKIGELVFYRNNLKYYILGEVFITLKEALEIEAALDTTEYTKII